MDRISAATTEEKEALTDKLGTFNSWPPHIQWVMPSVFADWFTEVIPRYMDTRQAFLDPDKGIRGGTAKLVLFVGPDFNGVGFRRGKHSNGNPWLRYFRFESCPHAYRVTHEENCYREAICTKCGVKTAVDSSG